MREIKDKTLQKKVVNKGYALTQSSFKHYHEEIRMSNVDALKWINNIPMEKWTRAFDNGQQWTHMTTNLMELRNFIFKGIRNLTITVLVRSIYFRLGSLFTTRGLKWSSVLESWQLFSESFMKFIKEKTAKANTNMITIFELHRHTFSVEETTYHNEWNPKGYYRVKLNRGWCYCRQFQASLMPCYHFITTCSYACQDAFKHLYAVYKVIKVFSVYNNSFPVVEIEEYWPTHRGNIICHNKNIRRKKKDRRNNTHVKIETNTAGKMVKLYGTCLHPRHTQKHCPNLGTSSTR